MPVIYFSTGGRQYEYFSFGTFLEYVIWAALEAQLMAILVDCLLWQVSSCACLHCGACAWCQCFESIQHMVSSKPVPKGLRSCSNWSSSCCTEGLGHWGSLRSYTVQQLIQLLLHWGVRSLRSYTVQQLIQLLLHWGVGSLRNAVTPALQLLTTLKRKVPAICYEFSAHSCRLHLQ